ncbi:MAG: S-layer protein [Candidatus Woesearchaeota archaeon]
MLIVSKHKNRIFSLPASELSPAEAKHISSQLALKIIKLISEKPSYPLEIARALRVNEQKVYYHIRNLERAGIISVHSSEVFKGAMAKYYSLSKPAFVLRFSEMRETSKLFHLEGESSFLAPFIKDGQLDANFILGSPDPHGPEGARSRDDYYAVDFALFLGTFLNYVPSLTVKLDTEVRREDLNSNLILIGGPVTNKIVEKINPKLPVRFEKADAWHIYSSLSNKRYFSDEAGLIVKASNPFSQGKSILLLAGRRYPGTRASVIAFLKKFSEVQKGNSKNCRIQARIVQGIDRNSDGIVDDVEFLE